MQTFKAFMKILKKHAPSISMYFIIFTVISLLTAHLNTDYSNNTFSSSKISIAVFDYDKSEESKALYDYLDRTHSIMKINDNQEEIADEMYYDRISYVLTIKQGFKNDYTNLENIKRPGSTEGEFVDHAIEKYVKLLDTYKVAGYNTADSIRLTNEAISKTSEVSFISSSTSNEENKKSITYFFRYIPYAFLASLIINLGNAFCIFRKKDLNARIQCSSQTITKRNLGIASAALVFSIGMLIIYLLLALLLYKSEMFTTIGLLKSLNAFVFLLFCVGFTYLLSFFVHSVNALNMVGNVFSLASCFFSGIFVPIEILSEGVKTAAHFLPTYWYILANDMTDVFSGSAAQYEKYFTYIGIEVLFAIVAFVAALAVSKLKKA